MSKNVKFKLNLPGLQEVMKSGEMQQIIDSAAGAIANAAGPGYDAESAHPIGFVAIASVYAGDFKAKLDNSRNKTLQKAAGSVKI